ncbi:hypothetical protein GOBAR_AA26707 [Gossypium barbadense]|uniref:Uncharacterized protein n=1 Tax=Gossypium barbadense TaxID=3634 RepID=A0A2P5WS95_GOSBA|nr:hypothetical protein GOBAR_AA26707 [Gossypium barbadense]
MSARGLVPNSTAVSTSSITNGAESEGSVPTTDVLQTHLTVVRPTVQLIQIPSLLNDNDAESSICVDVIDS